MTIIKYILRSLWYYKKQHFAVLASVIISTAVISAALIVGDSVKGSLKKLIDQRLGNTQYLIVSGSRLMRKEMAVDLSKKQNIQTIGILLVKGFAIKSETGERINSVQILGINEDFTKIAYRFPAFLKDNEVVISANMAKKLSLKINDEFVLKVENTQIIPINAPFSDKEKANIALRLIVKSIATEKQMGNFSLQNNQQLEYNVFISHDFLTRKLNIEGKINAILITDNEKQIDDLSELKTTLSQTWQLADVGYRWKIDSNLNYIELTSERIFIDSILTEKAEKLKFPCQKIYSYLVNSISFHNNETPYSFVSAINQPFFNINYKEDDIIINQWLATDLNANIGDTLILSYYVIGSLNRISEENATFIVKDICVTESDFLNTSLMPSFPGLSDAGSCRDWDAGIPIKFSKIRDKDEEYWNKYKGTPKALISYKDGNRIWKNQFGNSTSLRFFQNETSIDSINKQILQQLKPEDFEIKVKDIKQEALHAANNSVDFAGLFLALSFFIIVAALILTILIHSLNIKSRFSESFVLMSLGFNPTQLILFRMLESIIVILIAALIGTFVAILFTSLILNGLNGIWNNAVHIQSLGLIIQSNTLVFGFVISFFVSMVSILSINFRNPNQSKLLFFKIIPLKTTLFLKLLIMICLLISSIFISLSFLYESFNKEIYFLISGFLILIGMLVLSNLILIPSKINTLNNILLLAIKNAGLNKKRSLAAITILAFGTFSVIITGAFYKNKEFINSKISGTGGFLFWVETTVPIVKDLNLQDEKQNLIFDNNTDTLGLKFTQLLIRNGDDASCLNLNQIKQPRLIGINADFFDKRKAFTFKNFFNANPLHPWMLLTKKIEDNYIPAFADQTVITYGLKKKIGDTLNYIDDFGKKITLKLMGGLDNSIFQGSLLINEKIMMQHFPSSYQSTILLVDGALEKQETIHSIITKSFAEYGPDVKLATERLAEFNTVENTYISVFMILGALGLIIGTIGLSIVLLRNTYERKHELAILSAIGFSKKRILNLICIENLFLLILGVFIGIISAIIAIIPSLLAVNSSFPILFIVTIIISMLVNGFSWIYLTAKFAIKQDMISNLKVL